jgi:hypothetical protein
MWGASHVLGTRGGVLHPWLAKGGAAARAAAVPAHSRGWGWALCWAPVQGKACGPLPARPPVLELPARSPSLHTGGLTCSDPEQQDYGATFSSCPGYVPNGQALGDPGNVRHFAAILASHPLPGPHMHLKQVRGRRLGRAAWARLAGACLQLR